MNFACDEEISVRKIYGKLDGIFDINNNFSNEPGQVLKADKKNFVKLRNVCAHFFLIGLSSFTLRVRSR